MYFFFFFYQLVGKIVLRINDNVLCKTVLPFLIHKSHSDCIYVRLAALLSFPELGHALDMDHKTKVLVSSFVFSYYHYKSINVYLIILIYFVFIVASLF